MNVTLIAVGKLKERYLTDACAEYEKRLGAYCRLRVVEVDEYRLPQNPSEAQ
ncbi:MAG TPA: 23S rRNA (pseudouridine(1915)-N(3))-methyltransferase RlmH, partial [Firmicutes bacterium]|nr:23S rRNA (pseudouridine(1915)-N(3))-methyltransferase RlmH [Bacillota bacterium]